jgi:hypothetical protein
MITNMWEVKCDGDNCDEKEYFSSANLTFKEVIEEIKNAGWMLRYNDDAKPEHYCENCANQFMD